MSGKNVHAVCRVPLVDERLHGGDWGRVRVCARVSRGDAGPREAEDTLIEASGDVARLNTYWDVQCALKFAILEFLHGENDRTLLDIFP